MLSARTSGIANDEVLKDFGALRAAKMRGELRAHHHYRVVHDERGARRVVPAAGPRTAADRDRRLRQIEASMTSDRERRLRKAEAAVLSRADRLARALAAVDLDFASAASTTRCCRPGSPGSG